MQGQLRKLAYLLGNLLACTEHLESLVDGDYVFEVLVEHLTGFFH